MEKGKNFIFSLAAVIVGERVIGYPLSGNISNDLLGGFFGIVFGAVLILALKYGYKKVKVTDPAIKTVLLLAVIVFSFISFLLCILSFSEYAKRVMLNVSSVLIPLLSFVVLVLFTAKKGICVILKQGSVLFFLSAVFILLIFAFSLPFIEIKYLNFYKAPTLNGFASSFFTVGSSTFLSALPMLFIGKDLNPKKFLFGFLLGGSAILVCLINTLGIFGAEFSATLSYPYSSAVSTASVGQIFSRMDLFLYAVCFFTCLVKCSFCIGAIISSVKKLTNKILFQKN